MIPTIIIVGSVTGSPVHAPARTDGQRLEGWAFVRQRAREEILGSAAGLPRLVTNASAPTDERCKPRGLQGAQGGPRIPGTQIAGGIACNHTRRLHNIS